MSITLPTNGPTTSLPKRWHQRGGWLVFLGLLLCLIPGPPGSLVVLLGLRAIAADQRARGKSDSVAAWCLQRATWRR
jgi:hypothetical protein